MVSFKLLDAHFTHFLTLLIHKYLSEVNFRQPGCKIPPISFTDLSFPHIVESNEGQNLFKLPLGLKLNPILFQTDMRSSFPFNPPPVPGLLISVDGLRADLQDNLCGQDIQDGQYGLGGYVAGQLLQDEILGLHFLGRALAVIGRGLYFIMGYSGTPILQDICFRPTHYIRQLIPNHIQKMPATPSPSPSWHSTPKPRNKPHSSLTALHSRLLSLQKNAISQRRHLINSSKKELNRSWRNLCDILKMEDHDRDGQEEGILDTCLRVIVRERICLQRENIQVQRIRTLYDKSMMGYGRAGLRGKRLKAAHKQKQ